MNPKKMRISVYPCDGEPYSELGDMLETMKVSYKTRQEKALYRDGLGIFYIAEVSREEYKKLWNCAEQTGGFVEVMQ